VTRVGRGANLRAVTSPIDVPALLDALRRALEPRGPQLARIGGEVELVIVGHDPPRHTVRLGPRGAVELVAAPAAAPIVRIGFVPTALAALVAGTLDAEAAFRDRQLAVEGDLEALARFAACFAPAQSVIGVRSRD
jgi:hypothetical protein